MQKKSKKKSTTKKLIPSSFEVLGHTVTVEHKSLVDFGDNYGSSEFIRTKIEVSQNDKRGAIPISAQEHTFYHELVHTILEAMGEKELNDNEKFVDTFGGLLHQFMRTAKF